jgi:hypothetical protein
MCTDRCQGCDYYWLSGLCDARTCREQRQDVLLTGCYGGEECSLTIRFALIEDV